MKNALTIFIKPYLKEQYTLQTAYLKTFVAAYKTYLEAEVAKYEDGSKIKEKAQNRLDAITDLETNIDTEKTDITKIYQLTSKALKICSENEPTWGEKPFIEKLVDILTLGILPLIRLINGTEESRTVDGINSWVNSVKGSNPEQGTNPIL